MSFWCSLSVHIIVPWSFCQRITKNEEKDIFKKVACIQIKDSKIWSLKFEMLIRHFNWARYTFSTIMITTILCFAHECSTVRSTMQGDCCHGFFFIVQSRRYDDSWLYWYDNAIYFEIWNFNFEVLQSMIYVYLGRLSGVLSDIHWY